MKDNVVIITGGATGIGFALAKAFGRQGARIIIAEPREAHLQEAVKTLDNMGLEATYFVCDVVDITQVEALADFAWETYGQVNLLINNAGVSQSISSLVDTSAQEMQRVFDVNVFGVWNGCKVFGARLIEQGTPAAIYNTGSENSFFVAVPKASAYVASKHAVLGLTETLREEMPDFITVGLIAPGFVGSDLIPENIRHVAMPPEDFADIAVKQIIAGERYVVSHSYNQVHIDARYNAISKAYSRFAPRYAGDDKFDIRTLLAKLRAITKK